MFSHVWSAKFPRFSTHFRLRRSPKQWTRSASTPFTNNPPVFPSSMEAGGASIGGRPSSLSSPPERRSKRRSPAGFLLHALARRLSSSSSVRAVSSEEDEDDDDEEIPSSTTSTPSRLRRKWNRVGGESANWHGKRRKNGKISRRRLRTQLPVQKHR